MFFVDNFKYTGTASNKGLTKGLQRFFNIKRAPEKRI